MLGRVRPQDCCPPSAGPASDPRDTGSLAGLPRACRCLREKGERAAVHWPRLSPEGLEGKGCLQGAGRRPASRAHAADQLGGLSRSPHCPGPQVLLRNGHDIRLVGPLCRSEEIKSEKELLKQRQTSRRGL